MKIRARETQENSGKNSRPVFEGLSAALLRCYRQRAALQKNSLYERSARGSWDPRLG